MLYIGSHVGFKKDSQLLGSLQEALSYGANTFMFYTGAPQNTSRYPILDGLTLEAMTLMKEHGFDYSKVVVHAPYIINLANDKDPDKFMFSVRFLQEELERCELLGIRQMVLHPGSHVGLGQLHVIPIIGIVRAFHFPSNFSPGGKAQHRRDKHIRTECRIGLAELVHDRHPDVPITRLQGITHVLVVAAIHIYFRQFSSTAQERELRADGKMQIFSKIIFRKNGKHAAIQELVRREDLLIDV